MTLSEEQIKALKGWLGDGKKISEVQTLLSDKFGVNITYMDLRFLIDDLDIELKKEPDPVAEDAKENAGASEGVSEEQPESGKVRVELDKVQRPGILASGSVVFSDGTTGSWQLDQLGRFGLSTDKGADYRPSESDMAEFQNALRSLLG